MEKKKVDQFGKAYDKVIIWYVTKSCNFTCLQCAGRSLKINSEYAPEKINTGALKNFLDNSGLTFKFSFTGGEPLLVENIVEAFREITRNHYLAFISNMVSPVVKEIAEQIDPGRVNFITASAHLHELEKRNLTGTFISHCLLLKERGFNLAISEVAYPFMIADAERYRQFFRARGLELEFMAFRGTCNKKSYPDAYTEEEIKIFNLDKAQHTRHDIFNQQHKLCNAGYNIAVVDNKGDARPCFSLAHKIGNIYKKIRFSGNLIKCPLDFCGCPYSAFEPYVYKKALDELITSRSPGNPAVKQYKSHFLYPALSNALRKIFVNMKKKVMP